jgi:hypothetical protein
MTANPIAIPHVGAKPAWLEDDMLVEFPPQPHPLPASDWAWSPAWKYFLPANHWASAVLAAGLEPWNPTLQGEWPPVNYAGGRVMTRKGEILDPAQILSWKELIGFEPAAQPAPRGEDGAREFHFVLEWIAAPRPPVHPEPSIGRQSFETFDKAARFMAKQASDAKFVSLIEVITRKVDLSSDLRAALKDGDAGRGEG